MGRLLISCLVVFIVSSSSLAWAQAPDEVRLLLLAHDGPPSLTAFSQATVDPVCLLQAIALDEAELTLVRRRAVLMLGRYDDPSVEPFLVSLLETTPVGSIRRASASALSRRLASNAPERLVDILEPMLRMPDPIDREIAVWLIGRLDHPRAIEVLAERRIIERHRAVVDALRHVLTMLANERK